MVTMHEFRVRTLILLVFGASVAAQYENCTGEVERISDGLCDDVNNSVQCDYDGGDCCECTCIDGPEHVCGEGGYDCQDPVAGSALYNCQATPIAPCSADIPVYWVVEDTVSATVLAEAIFCSSGDFHVEWRGHVIVDQPIYVVNGTSLNVSGADPEARMEAATGGIRLFSVADASLSVSTMHLSNGNATFGGAIAASRSTIRLNQMFFTDNNASFSGGAIYAAEGSTVFLRESTELTGNNAGLHGGALCIDSASSLFLFGTATFVGNKAFEGGALSVEGVSSALWDAETFFVSNSADGNGGALRIHQSSTVSWLAGASFLHNTAAAGGGAISVEGVSSVWWEEDTVFSGNHADDEGGAVLALNKSIVSWRGNTSFSSNIAGASGGALDVSLESLVSWEGATSFTSNSAWSGGALRVSESNVSWSAETSFSHCHADSHGGAILFSEANGSWKTVTTFTGNTAGSSGGGALFAEARSNVSGQAMTSFSKNSAGSNGGAIYVDSGSTVAFGAETTFSENNATGDGGAVYLYNSYSKGTFSSFVLSSTTTFDANSCEGSGGGMTITAASSVTFSTESITFSDNSAGLAGGAIFVSGLGVGPRFIGLIFKSNSAKFGGGVAVTACGTTITEDYDSNQMRNPTTFIRCKFISNKGVGSGGAVDSGAGIDTFRDTEFTGNSATYGGALRLGGTASLHNCSFTDNTSNDGVGPAVYNIGFMSGISDNNFEDNVFNCEEGTFLDFNTSAMSDDLYDVVCKGCDLSCVNCNFPGVADVPLCIDTLEHSTSTGGNTTLETLEIDDGYWRATNTSTAVLACFNTGACVGGVTGSPDYCDAGYEGPYCSICSEGYTSNLGYTCSRCSEGTTGVAIVISVLVLAVFIVGAFLVYMVSDEWHGSSQGKMGSWTQRVLPSLKIVIVTWQIVTQFASVANIQYEDMYQRFLDWINMLNFEIGWILSTGCIIDVNIHQRLLMSTIGPLIGMSILGATYLFAARRYRGSNSSLDKVRQKHLYMVLLLMFLVYSPVSSNLFKMFACDKLEDGKTYLRADYRLECNCSIHSLLQIYAGCMIVLYTAGIPMFYATLLFRNRDVLVNRHARRENAVTQSTSGLWEAYKPYRFFYELIECARRVLLAGIIVFVFPSTAAQVAITLLMAVLFMIVSEALAPYERKWDAWVSRIGHTIVLGSMYVALLLKVDISNERGSSQKVFEVILVCAHAFMILAVAIEAIFAVCPLVRRQHEDPKPRFRGSGKEFPFLVYHDDVDEDDSSPTTKTTMTESRLGWFKRSIMTSDAGVDSFT